MKDYNRELGIFGEKIAEQYLQYKGYKIVARNYQSKYGEIDLIMGKDNYLVFVEVKTRKNSCLGIPEYSINKRKYKKLKQNAAYYVFQNKHKNTYRIDAVCIVLSKINRTERINHYQNISV